MPTVLRNAMLRKANDSLRTNNQEQVVRSLGRFSEVLDERKKTDRIKVEDALRTASQRVLSRGR